MDIDWFPELILTLLLGCIPRVVSAIVGSELAAGRGRRTEGFWLGFVFGPIGIVIALLLSTKVPASHAAEQRKDFQALVQNRGRIGALVSDVDGVTIISVTPEGPAERAGLKVGDRLVTIDGTLVTNDYKVNVLRATGEKGTTATLAVRRGDAIHTFTVERA